jgi:hypothetical protein
MTIISVCSVFFVVGPRFFRASAEECVEYDTIDDERRLFSRRAAVCCHGSVVCPTEKTNVSEEVIWP